MRYVDWQAIRIWTRQMIDLHVCCGVFEKTTMRMHLKRALQQGGGRGVLVQHRTYSGFNDLLHMCGLHPL